MDANILICIPTKGLIQARTVNSLRANEKFLESKGIKCDVAFGQGTVVPMVRTKLVEEFLKFPSFTHMLFVDSDQTFEKDYIYKLLEHDKDIITAVSKVRSGEVYNVYEFDSNLDKYIGMKEVKERGLIKVEAAGMGMMLLKRKVLQCINKIETKGDRSEDIYFCEKARALNFEIWADCNLILGHIVEVELK